MGLARGVQNRGRTLRQACGHQDMFGRRHTRLIKEDQRPFHSLLCCEFKLDFVHRHA